MADDMKLHLSGDFACFTHMEMAPAALARWKRISLQERELILERIWCPHCDGCHGIHSVAGELHPSGDIILRGFCPACGGKICRVLETGERMGPATESP